METKTYFSEWATLARHNGLLYRVWRAPGWGRDVLQLLVPKDWDQLVPVLCQRTGATCVHSSVGAGHYGVAKTLKKLRQRFYWPGCRKDTELFIHCCDSCTAKKGPTGRSHAPLQQYQVGAPMERVGVDILGPFPITDSGNRYVLVAMDYFTKWPEAYAVPDQSAVTTAEGLVCEMFCRFGAPQELHSDQGRNFEAQVFAEVCKRMGVSKTRTTPLKPPERRASGAVHLDASHATGHRHLTTPARLGPPPTPCPVGLSLSSAREHGVHASHTYVRQRAADACGPSLRRPPGH